jgi:hypothetical protein
MAKIDIVPVPFGTRVNFKTTPPGDNVITYETHLLKIIDGGEPAEVATWPPAKTEGPGGDFTMDLTGEDDAYEIVLTFIGNAAGTMHERLTYTPPPPAARPYESPVVNGENTSEWSFLKA